MAEHPRKIGKVSTVDMQTGEVIQTKENAFTLLPAAPGVCPECGVGHAWDQPHDQQSLLYQMRFQGTHGRWPTWTDAMQHCTPEVRARWREHLVELMQEKGIAVPADLLTADPGAGR